MPGSSLLVLCRRHDAVIVIYLTIDRFYFMYKDDRPQSHENDISDEPKLGAYIQELQPGGHNLPCRSLPVLPDLSWVEGIFQLLNSGELDPMTCWWPETETNERG